MTSIGTPPGYPVYLTTTGRLVGYLNVQPMRDLPYMQFHCWDNHIKKFDPKRAFEPMDHEIHICTLRIERDQYGRVMKFWIEPGQKIYGVRGWTPA